MSTQTLTMMGMGQPDPAAAFEGAILGALARLPVLVGGCRL
jgi:hypothetical protein